MASFQTSVMVMLVLVFVMAVALLSLVLAKIGGAFPHPWRPHVHPHRWPVRDADAADSQRGQNAVQ